MRTTRPLEALEALAGSSNIFQMFIYLPTGLTASFPTGSKPFPVPLPKGHCIKFLICKVSMKGLTLTHQDAGESKWGRAHQSTSIHTKYINKGLPQQPLLKTFTPPPPCPSGLHTLHETPYLVLFKKSRNHFTYDTVTISWSCS